METRQAGVLLPVFSLPSPYGIGSLGKAAYDWIDWLVAARMRIWQMLPLVPTGDGNSPYSSVCASAFSPYLIDMDTLVERGLLDADDLRALRCGDDPTRVDYARVRETHDLMLRKAFGKFDRTQADFVAFAQLISHITKRSNSCTRKRLGRIGTLRCATARPTRCIRCARHAATKSTIGCGRSTNACGSGTRCATTPAIAAYC